MVITPGSIVFDKNGNEYVVGDFLGNGSFGFVNKLVLTSNKEIYALKTVLPGFDSTETERSFFNEGELALKINHLNVIKYLYFHDGSTFEKLPPYIIMEYANQGNLGNLIQSKFKTKQCFTNDELVSMYQQLINGMTAINNILVHRDIKPDNILMHNDVLKISDFGLAKVAMQQTRTATFKGIGHLAYLAPEGWQGQSNTIQMDIYSMGLVFFQLATLNHAYDVSQTGDVVENWKAAHLFTPPKNAKSINPSLSSSLDGLIRRMIDKSMTNRLSNWADVQTLLDKHIAPACAHSTSIESIVTKIAAIESQETAEELAAKKAAKEKMDFENIVAYQFKNGIIQPFQEWADEFNAKSPTAQVHIGAPQSNSHSYICLNVTADIARRLQININITPLYNYKWRYERTQRDYHRVFNRVDEIEPTLDGKKILAWGYVKDSNQRGFNLFLLEKKGDIYGNWVMMFNGNSGFNRQPRTPEPFAFEIDEFQRELPLIRAVHIYNSEIETFEITRLITFIKEGIQK